ncbi:MAG: cation:proton antiporter [Cuniculiplasma sp.]
MLTIQNKDFIQLSLLLIIASFSIPIARKASLVEIPILIALGLLFGPGLGIISHSFAQYMIQDFAGFGVGILGLVIILYYESHNINFRVIRKFIINIVSLNTVGMVVTSVVGGIFFTLLTGSPFLIGFLFGAIISPTDPSTLIPLFKKIKIKDDYSGTLIGESLFNDPLAIILVTLAISFIYEGSSYSPLFNSVTGAVGLIGGIPLFLIIQIAVPSIFGIFMGFAIIYLNKYLNFENLIVGLLLGVILFELTILYGIGITPFPAIIATGAIVGTFSDKSIFWSRESNFQENLSFLAQGVIFILVGSLITVSEITGFLLQGLILTLLVIFVVRPLAVFISLPPGGSKKGGPAKSWRTKVFIALSGPRGVVSVVEGAVPYAVGLASGNALLLRWGPVLEIDVTFIVLLSILMQTVYLPIIAGRLLPQETAQT